MSFETFNFKTVKSIMEKIYLIEKKCVKYSKLMINNYPNVCNTSIKQMWKDITSENYKPTQIFDKWKPLIFEEQPQKNKHYAAQAVFRSQFKNRDKLRDCMFELGAEMSIPPESLYIEFDDKIIPTAYSDNNTSQTSNHYLFRDKINYNFKKHSKRFTNYIAAMQIFENLDEDTGEFTTVMWLYLPGKKLDGTSCFNFMKEIVGRYYGVKNTNVTKSEDILKIKPDAYYELNNPIFIIRFFLLLPFMLFFNLSATMWEKTEAIHEPQKLQSSGEREMSFLNLTAKESKDMCVAFRASSIPPSAGIIYMITNAYHRAVGNYPYGINIQVSLQTRSFTPVVKERYFIGDWLVGPCYTVRSYTKELLSHMKTREKTYFSIEDAKSMYEKLIHDVETTTGKVREAFIAREYGVVKGGPAPFQNHEMYGDLNRMSDSILFNNYGKRNMHMESKLVSWNWSGPGKLNCNTISVNGCTSITFASTLIGVDLLTKIRDDVKKMIKEYVSNTNQLSG